MFQTLEFSIINDIKEHTKMFYRKIEADLGRSVSVCMYGWGTISLCMSYFHVYVI